MGKFIYFIPAFAGSVMTRADFEKLGLGYVLPDSGSICSKKITKGPDDGPGTLAGDDELLQYSPATQTWRKGPEGKFWVGMTTDSLPTPESLARTHTFDGESVKLLDGNDWIIPRAVAIVPGRHRSLPKRLTLGEDGHTLQTTPYTRFEKLSADTFRFFQEISLEETDEAKFLTADERAELAINALGANYAIGRVEAVGLLQLIGEIELADILHALIDARAIREYVATAAAEAGGAEKKD